MTCIAADARAGIMVSDSRCTSGETWYPITKVFRVRNEIVGFAGDVKIGQRWLKWYRGDRRTPVGKLGDEFIGLILRDGELFEACSNGLELRIERKFHAVGSGGHAALGAMLAGASAEQSVAIACDIDTGCGGEIQTFTFKVES